MNERFKGYEVFNDNIKYKRLNIDFNDYGYNKYEEEKNIVFSVKTGPDCVKKRIKR